MKNLIILLSLFNISLLFSQTSSDIKGWRDAEWGMSVEEVQKIFNTELSEIDNPKAFPNDYYPFMIKSYEIAGQKYDIKFIFKKDNHTLYQIKIVKMLEYGSSWRNIIVELDAALTEKYGTPYFKSEDPYNCKWSLPSTKIELEYLEVLDGAIFLSYSQQNDNNKSKL